jgi:hypothetical protein
MPGSAQRSVSQVPGEHTLDGDDDPLSRRCHDSQEGLWVGLPMAVHHNFAALREDTDRHRSGMQLDAAGNWGRSGVKAPKVSSLCITRVSPSEQTTGSAQRGPQ